MKRRSLIILLTAALIIIVSIPSSAGLKDFKSGTETEENTSSSESSGTGDGCGDAIIEVFGEIFIMLWLAHNLPIEYAGYPYQEEYNRKMFYWNESFHKGPANTESYGTAAEPSAGTAAADTPHWSSWYLNLRGGFHRTTDDVNAGFVSLTGKFVSFLGPELEYAGYHDADGTLHFTKAGLNIPLVQNDYFSMDFYGGAAFFGGILRRNGGCYGLNLMTLPVKPLVIRGRIGGVSFDNITYTEYAVTAGVLYKRIELFGGYRSLDSTEGLAVLHGWQAGLSVWF